MQEIQNPNSLHLRKTLRVFLKVIICLFLFALLLFFLILTPPVQRFVTGKVENYLENKLQTKVEIGKISFGLSGNIHLENIYFEDQQGDTLFAGGSITANVALFKLFSNEVQVKDIELQNIYANIRRELPDTLFNFQFLVNAFISEQTKDADTAQTAPLKLNISDFTLENVRLRFVDVVTGSDMFAKIGNLSATIQKMDPTNYDFDISSIIGRNVTANIKQHKPMFQAEPASNNASGTVVAPPMKLNLGTVDLSRFSVKFDNDVSNVYSNFTIGRVKAEGKNFDLVNNTIHLENLELDNAKSVIRLGKSEAAKTVQRQVKKEVELQAQKGWSFRVDELRINNNAIRFDNDNTPKAAHGMDFAHLDVQQLNFHTNNLVFSPDTIGGVIAKGSFREQSGFVLEELTGELLYASTKSYLKNLFLKTPGSVIRRSAVLDYASFDALVNNFPRTVMDVEIVDSRIQVKDILAFAPQLRNNPAFSNPNAIWDLSLVGTGTLNNLHLEAVQFNGLRNTVLNASGTLTGLMTPDNAGGNFTIHRLRTSQADIALFTGQRLSTPQINLPETFDINGTIRGNAGSLNTNLNVNSSAGFVSLNGNFSNLMNPAKMKYNARVQTSGLALGSILRQQGTIGSVSGNFSFNGTGITPESINTRYSGNINRLGYNQYTYRNINVNGTLVGDNFTATLDVNDPNADLDLQASGSFGANTSFRIDGMIDSIKTLPLNFTTDPLVFRGQINGDITSLNPDYLDANLLITRALIVSNEERLVLDTIELVSGHSDTANYIHLRSDIANASIEGQYRFSELGSIVQSSIEPYFSVTPSSSTPQLQPYNFRFSADLTYNPIFSAFIPGLTAMEPLHTEGSFVSGQGVNGIITTQHLSLQGNEVSDLNVSIATTAKGLEVEG